MPSFGTIKADTLTHSTAGSLATNYVVNGTAKMFVAFNTRTSTSVNKSLTVSSLTDSGTGNTTITFTSAMSAADYCQTMGMGDFGTTWTTSHALAATQDSHKTASQTKFNTGGAVAQTASDLYENGVVAHGDLA